MLKSMPGSTQGKQLGGGGDTVGYCKSQVSWTCCVLAAALSAGDHALTGLAIGEMLGIAGNGSVISGPEIDAMDDEHLRLVRSYWCVAVGIKTTADALYCILCEGCVLACDSHVPQHAC